MSFFKNYYLVVHLILCSKTLIHTRLTAEIGFALSV